MFSNREHTRTLFVQLDTQKCKACWKCIRKCSSEVISKLNLPFHKHALIVKPEACTGCLKCVNICRHNAFSINNTEQETEKHSKQTFYSFIINNLLLIFGLGMILPELA